MRHLNGVYTQGRMDSNLDGLLPEASSKQSVIFTKGLIPSPSTIGFVKFKLRKDVKSPVLVNSEYYKLKQGSNGHGHDRSFT